ncbi:MAG: hypothetical protein PHI96_10245 [Desulfovibrio sp.]|nr:hypothetical protein [Desulfovibrio sp.]
MTSDTYNTGFSQENAANNTASAHTAAGSNSYLGASGTSASTSASATVPAQGDAGSAHTSGQNADQTTGQDLLHSQVEQHLRQQEAARHTQWQNQVSQWREEVSQDPQLGGVNMAANVARAQLALDRFDQGRHIGRLLEESGYGNHPEVLRFFNRVADALMEDSLVRGEPGSNMPPLEERMYAGWSSRK